MCKCLYVLACAVVTALLLTSVKPYVAHAQAGCESVTPTMPVTGEISQSVQIAEPIAERNGNAHPVGQFHQQHVVINLPSGSRVLVSGSSDGQSGLCSDDFAEMYVSGTGNHWQHDFRSNGGIAAILPVDVTHLFATGDNVVTLTLTDLMDPAYSSSAYYIVVFAPSATATPLPSSTSTPSLTPSETARATATASATATDTATPTASATSTAINTPSPTPTPSATPSPTPTATEVMVAAPTAATDDNNVQWNPLPPGFMPIVLSVFGVLVVLAMLWRGQRRKPQMAGEVTVYHNDSFVGAHVLDGLSQTVMLNANGQRIESDQQSDQALFRIYARGAGRNRQMIAEQLVAGEVQEQYILQHGDDVHAGALCVHYDNYVQMEFDFEPEEPIYEFSNR